MIFESAVKRRLGRMEDGWGKLPVEKSVLERGMEYRSDLGRVVIWHRITSSPSSCVTTKAGRSLLAVRLENGKGTTTTSPLTNFSMPHPRQADPSLLRELARMRSWFDTLLNRQSRGDRGERSMQCHV
jgi:hypothetical protein